MTTSSASAHAPRAVVAGHGTFADGVISAVACICGRGDAFLAVTNEGCTGPGVEDAIRTALAAHGATVVFTDLPAGSCTMAARRIARTDPLVAVVTGATVAMLLEFALGSGEAAADLERAAGRGREAITVHPPTGAPDGA